MYPIHPLTVHFPLALLLANGLLTVLYLRHGNRDLEVSAYYCLLLGWCGAVLAVFSGLWDAWTQVYSSSNDMLLLNWVNAHAAVGLALTGVYGKALLDRRRQPTLLDDRAARRGYLRLLAVGAGLVVLNGWLGGRLVYGFGIGVGG
jgi:uncharacterized membrane protein